MEELHSWLSTIMTLIIGGIITYRVQRQLEYQKQRDEEKREEQRELENAHMQEMARRQEREASRDDFMHKLANGTVALLRDRLLQSCAFFEEQGWITDIALRNIDSMYQSYHALGGNDIVTAQYHKVLKLPIKRVHTDK